MSRLFGPMRQVGIVFFSSRRGHTSYIGDWSSDVCSSDLPCVADPERLRVGDAWMVQAPGNSGLWGRIELRSGAVASRYSAPDGKPSDKVASLKKQQGEIGRASCREIM